MTGDQTHCDGCGQRLLGRPELQAGTCEQCELDDAQPGPADVLIERLQGLGR